MIMSSSCFRIIPRHRFCLKLISGRTKPESLKTLESKYGQPQVVRWKEENGSSMYWMKNGDFLIISLVPDQFGNPTYQIVIYFVKNLEQLIATEKDERKEKALERTQSGETGVLILDQRLTKLIG